MASRTDGCLDLFELPLVPSAPPSANNSNNSQGNKTAATPRPKMKSSIAGFFIPGAGSKGSESRKSAEGAVSHPARANIPGPPPKFIIGNVLDLQDENPTRALERLVDTYGPLVKFQVFGIERLICGSAELLEELSDEKRFWKSLTELLKSLLGDGTQGLFTAESEDDPDWGQAHRILMPVFGPLAIADMFDGMLDIASQMVLKFARQGSEYRIPVTDDFTRLTLDTIALCSMDYRFNSFYHEEMHPFIDAMNRALGASSERFKIESMLRRLTGFNKTDEPADRKFMFDIAQGLVKERRENPTEKKDLLNSMIYGKDPKTGKTMSDELISVNLVTFIIAGHETTSGLLSFAFLLMLKNPKAYFAAQAEVDRVLGRGPLTVNHLKELKYIDAVLRETLRLCPTAPGFVRAIRSDNPNDSEELLGGKFAIDREDRVIVALTKCQKDPKVYGEDAAEFRPERMLDEEFAKLPKGAWKPFGTGARACIGRAFAWQEAQMCMALLLQNFNFRLDDPTYEMRIKQTLTIKPDGFYMKATLRDGITATGLQTILSGGSPQAAQSGGLTRKDSGAGEGSKPMTIIYGSNTGTCQSLAQKLSMDARTHGFKAHVMDMDGAVDAIPKDQPLVVITASYEGQPPDNAAHFVTWLDNLTKADDTNRLSGVQYAVFGVGHSDWVDTFQRIPTRVDEQIAQLGGKRLADRGLANAAEANIFSDFDTWLEQQLWSALGSEVEEGKSVGFDLEISTQDRTSFLRQDVREGEVIDTKVLTGPGEPEKRHIEIKLPKGMDYTAGDYLAVLPLNPQESIDRVMAHFTDVPAHATISIKQGTATFLPTDQPISVTELLKGYVELSLPATKRDLQTLIKACKDSTTKSFLESTLKGSYNHDILNKRTSLLDLLETHPSIELPFSTYISMLPPLRPRHYSISSSPLASSTTCTITYSLLSAPSYSNTSRKFNGITTNYLSTLSPGSPVHVSVRSTNLHFHLPSDPESTPILMLCAGSGLAPFRGFLQERATQIAAGRPLAKALIYIGCRNASSDRLYAEEMDAWIRQGVVDVRYTYSQEPSEQGWRYVQDRLWDERDEVTELWNARAKVFVCGGPGVSAGVSAAAVKILRELKRVKEGKEITEDEAWAWFKERRNERYVVDTFI